jgi:peptidoglycan/xylan/chitin deacetylase (PgdA/CDA1 family)
MKRLLGRMLWPLHARLAAHYFVGQGRGLVLTFHYIGEPVLPGAGDDLFLSGSEFRGVLEFIAGELTPLAPPVFFNLLRTGKLPRRATLITFDDCDHHTVAYALPELTRLRLSACFFVNPGLIAAGRPVPSIELMCLCAGAPHGCYELSMAPDLRIEIGDAASRAAAYRKLWPLLLNCPSTGQTALLRRIREGMKVGKDVSRDQPLAGWDVLRKVDEAGMLVGNHTMFHSTIATDGIERFESEVAGAYTAIEEQLGRKPRIFCYPYGRPADSADGAGGILRGLHTEFAFVTRGGFANPARTGRLELHREDASYSADATKLAPLLACLR